MKTKVIVIVSIFLIFLANASFAFQIVRGCIHEHSSEFSDGYETVAEVGEQAKKNCDFLWLTDHSDMFNRDEDRLIQYREKVAQLNSDDFIAVAGREISLEKDLCHVGAYSEVAMPYMKVGGSNHDQVNDLVNILKNENALYCVNHIKDCPAWENKVNLFPCMELMNDIGINLQTKKNYNRQFGLYLKNLQSNWRGWVVAGIDHHKKGQNILTGNLVTYIFPDCFSRECIVDALRDGRTIATKNTKIINIDNYPSQTTRDVDSIFRISGVLEIPSKNLGRDMNVYRQGVLYQKIALEKRFVEKGITTVRFTFWEKAASTEKTCYTLEIPYLFISSPYCFAKKSEIKFLFPPQECLTGVTEEELEKSLTTQDLYPAKKEGNNFVRTCMTYFEIINPDLDIDPEFIILRHLNAQLPWNDNCDKYVIIVGRLSTDRKKRDLLAGLEYPKLDLKNLKEPAPIPKITRDKEWMMQFFDGP